MRSRSVWRWQGREIELVDTAGLRRKARIAQDSLERLSGKAALAALRRAEIVLLLVDASAPLEKQDLAIANLAVEAGRGLVVAANKWDLVSEPEVALPNPARAHREQAAAAQGRDLPADLGADGQGTGAAAAGGGRGARALVAPGRDRGR